MVNAEIVIDRTGQPIADAWATIGPEAELPAAGPLIVPLARVLAEPAILDLPGGLGAEIGPDDDLAALLPILPRLALVAVTFPKFRDGRGFTQIRALREHHGFAGEIRVVGHSLPDQFMNLVRCGASSVSLPQGQDPALWAAVLALHGGLDTRPVGERPLPLLRRLVASFEL
jgi:uncharacterized protein (DUF934 family)